jgi:ATP-dependent HslUV protease ATP-binding subunit HslU
VVGALAEMRDDLLRQYQALVAAENVKLEFTDDGVAEIARIAAQVNERMENIGARRLHTVMTTLLEDLLFDLPDSGQGDIRIDGDRVRDRLRRVLEDDDLRRYIL